MKRILVFSLLALAAVAAASLAYAAIPSANGVISACIDTGGELKLIDVESGAVCSKNKEMITWNQQGPVGPAGPAGPIGPAGPAGAPGADGQDGIVGRVVVFDTSDVSSPSQRDVDVECPTGTVPIGGGGRPFAVPGGWTPWNIALGASYPTATGWFVTANEVNGGFNLDWVLRAYVICAAAS